MSTSRAHQQSLADAGSETHPPMLEKGSYIPWASRFKCYLNRKRETQKLLNHSIDVGPYEFKMIQPDTNQDPRRETKDDLMGDALKQYEVDIELMNDLKRNKIELPIVTINTKFLNFLQPEWIKYVTSVRLAKDLTKDPYDDLFDYLQQYEKLVIASRAKKLEKTHDPLALVAHKSSSSRSPLAYYVTHPSFIVDYDDDYQGDTFQNDP
ncbi:hypothetical protein Tco_0736823 [Tanacetum coccineum]